MAIIKTRIERPIFNGISALAKDYTVYDESGKAIGIVKEIKGVYLGFGRFEMVMEIFDDKILKSINNGCVGSMGWSIHKDGNNGTK